MDGLSGVRFPAAAAAIYDESRGEGFDLLTGENDEHLFSIARRHLGADPRATFVSADGNVFLREAARASFDLIFADTWPGKYENLESALSLLKEGGLYVVDDMDPKTRGLPVTRRRSRRCFTT